MTVVPYVGLALCAVNLGLVTMNMFTRRAMREARDMHLYERDNYHETALKLQGERHEVFQLKLQLLQQRGAKKERRAQRVEDMIGALLETKG